MDENIELKERGREEDKSSEEAREKEETSFTERTEETEDDYDKIGSRADSDLTVQSETNEGSEYDEDDPTELLRRR